MTRKLLSLAIVACCASAAHANTIFLDFQHNNRPDTPGYNSIVSSTINGAAISFTDMLDSNGVPTAIDVGHVGFPANGNSAGHTGVTGDAAIFADGATSDSLFGHTNDFNGFLAPNPIITFSDLDASGATTYDFVLYAGRNGGSIRAGDYVFTDANGSVAFTDYDASLNTSEVIAVNGLVADANGEISLSMTAGATNDTSQRFFYINAMRITTNVPEPSVLGLLSVAGLFGLRRRVR
ncbi:hypothetical protein Pla123a_01510 [Posidoniimonas polymericola]|uniref:PEP-CTERM protein-sorting domain-containing protein n=1 Tax=Posidoniimonas polymericola TaxID=2528002 RepID=A0A5C5ZDC5_9BACT|nr:PEP-CTERM sorting domain-containing protein [Posidoniimonas polymericola]TWT85344.1 hypothetical protein Pla123a_01510 [Posidoniimonas polymericola]